MKKISLLFVLVIMITSCNQTKQKKEELPIDNEVTSEEQKENEWTVLFDGSSLEHWSGYLTDSVPSEWSIEGNTLAFTPGEEGGKNIVSKTQFTNFILSLEWKISEAGNSGIFWGVHKDPKYNEVYETGPEIQVLDNERHPDAKIKGKLHQAGALYDMIEPAEDVAKPAGEWNTCVISIDHKENLGTVTLNGTTIVSFPVHGEKWEAMVANSKFKDWEGFGKYKTGHLALQDHSDKVWYRNIKIKKLPK